MLGSHLKLRALRSFSARSRSLSRLALALVLSALSPTCAPASEGLTARTPPPKERAPAAQTCVVLLEASVVAAGARSARLVVTAENVSRDPVTVEFPDRCPQGPIDFDGLGPSYDYYGTCNAGACAGPRPPLRATLSPRRAQTIAETEIHFDGRPPCTEPLEPGRVIITPVAPGWDVPTCVIRAEIDLPPREPPTAPEPPGRSPPHAPARTPTSPPPASPAQARADDPYACESPEDCVLACPGVAGCCGYPCGCKHAIHRDHLEAFTANRAKTCDPPPCPAVACRYEDAIGATCRGGRCRAAMSFTEL